MKIGIWSIEDITGPLDKFLADDGNVYALFECKKKVVDKLVKDKLLYELEILASNEEVGPTLVFFSHDRRCWICNTYSLWRNGL
jgi:hypothetical protein